MIIIDTNVVSEVMKARPSRAVIDWLNAQDPVSLFITAISIAEISFGINMLPDGKRRRDLATNFEHFVENGFQTRILDFDDVAAKFYGNIMAYRRSIGRPMSALDGQIAAIGRVNQFELATRNTKDFEECGLVLTNPFG